MKTDQEKFMAVLSRIRKAKCSQKISNPMSFRLFAKDLKNSFSIWGSLRNKVGPYQEKDRLGYRRNTQDRGKDQFKCFLAHLKAWIKTGTTQNYCWQCNHIFRMSGYTSAGITTECKLGHWRQESS